MFLRSCLSPDVVRTLGGGDLGQVCISVGGGK